MKDNIKNNKLIVFFSNPLVGILGSLASLLGLVLAVVFYYTAQLSPQLVYSVQPNKNILVNTDITSNISVLHKGELIQDKDIVAVTLSIWNSGNKSIRRPAILEPLHIKLDSSAEILEALVTKSSRDVTRIKVENDSDLFKKGIVPISWDILEQGDGANIQIIYAGKKDSQLTVTGIIEQQGKPVQLSTFTIKNNDNSYLNDIKVLKWLIPGILLFSVTITVFTFKGTPLLNVLTKAFFKKAPRNVKISWGSLIIACTPFVFGAVYIFLKLDEWYPPFGF
ncbi:TPA: hypothetical protein ACX6RS_004111 [Photobacterium damselae]